MMEKESVKYTVNVREMVEFLLRHGDIVPGDAFFSPERALYAQICTESCKACLKRKSKDIRQKKASAFRKKQTASDWR